MPRRADAGRGRKGRAATGLLVLLLAVVTAQVVLFVLPAGDAPRRSDAIVVLGGPGDRIDTGIALAAQGYADTLVLVSESPDECAPEVPVEQICFEPEPATTRGEAREVAAMATERGWDSLLVVAQNEQVVRARLRLERCLPDGVEVRMVAVRGGLWDSAYRVAYETGALPKALLLQTAC